MNNFSHKITFPYSETVRIILYRPHKKKRVSLNKNVNNSYFPLTPPQKKKQKQNSLPFFSISFSPIDKALTRKQFCTMTLSKDTFLE